MAGIGEDVHLRFYPGGFVFEVEGGHAFGDVWAVAVTGGDEERRHAFGGIEEAGGAGVDETLKVGTAGLLLDGVCRVFLPGIIVMAAKAASSPPAEKPRMPMQFGWMCHSAARLRTVRRARRASAMA